MDSGNNSGSMQSSSTGGGGGDEEYDSRAAESSSASLSAFLTTNNPPQPPPPTISNHHVGLFNHHHQQHLNAHHLFDPFSNYLDSTSSPSNLDMVWSRALRSEQNPTDLGNNNNNQAFLLNQFASAAVPATTVTHQLSLPPAENGSGLLLSSSNDQAQSNNSNNAVRNPKKRSRASRRAPTTVLTTDTTNFRAMVQEFTGIPAPPFSSSSHFPRTRLDLFGSGSGSGSAATSAPPYLLRPFAQKLQPPFHHAPSHSSIPSTNSTSINYQQQQINLPLNMQNSFQSILQAPQKYPLGNSSHFASKTQSSLEIPPPTTTTAAVDSHLKMGVMEGLGLLNHAHGNNTHINPLHQNMDGTLLSRVRVSNNNMQNSSGEWGQRSGAIIRNIDGDHHHGGVLGSLGGGTGRSSNNIPERVSSPPRNSKGNYSASPADFQGEKGPEFAVVAAAAGRSEGTVESWINCSSE